MRKRNSEDRLLLLAWPIMALGIVCGLLADLAWTRLAQAILERVH